MQWSRDLGGTEDLRAVSEEISMARSTTSNIDNNDSEVVEVAMSWLQLGGCARVMVAGRWMWRQDLDSDEGGLKMKEVEEITDEEEDDDDKIEQIWMSVTKLVTQERE